MILEWHSPCPSCSDDECDDSGCARFRATQEFGEAGRRMSAALSSLNLSDSDRRRAALAIAAAIEESLSLCGARLERSSCLAACGLTTEADHG